MKALDEQQLTRALRPFVTNAAQGLYVQNRFRQLGAELMERGGRIDDAPDLRDIKVAAFLTAKYRGDGSGLAAQGQQRIPDFRLRSAGCWRGATPS